MAITISVLTLLALIYQLYQQRVHNANSLKPLAQIKFVDQKTQLAVQVENCGMGPMIIDSLSFSKQGKTFPKIGECLDLAPRSYFSVSLDSEIKKVLLPNQQMDVFEKEITSLTQEEIDCVKSKLSVIGVSLVYRDIYNNRFSAKRNLEWFSRHID